MTDAVRGLRCWKSTLRIGVFAGLAILLTGTRVVAEPHADVYQLAFGPSQANGLAALAHIAERADVVYRYVACGREAVYLGLDQAKKADEDTLEIVLAKLVVYASWPNHASRDGDI